MIGQKTYATITSGLSKMVTDLEVLVDKQHALNAADEVKKTEIDIKIAERNTEISKSKKTVENIRKLVEV